MIAGVPSGILLKCFQTELKTDFGMYKASIKGTLGLTSLHITGIDMVLWNSYSIDFKRVRYKMGCDNLFYSLM